MFKSVEDVIEGLAGQNYLCDRKVATVVYLACALRKPILVEGPAGVGKTELGMDRRLEDLLRMTSDLIRQSMRNAGT